MLDKILYYSIVLPVSRLPMGAISLFADLLYIVFRYIWPYREKVISDNLKRAFPSLSSMERREIKLQYYRYLSNLVIESIKNLSVSEDELLDRLRVKNPELMQELYAADRNVILLSSHFNNWEFLIKGLSLLFPFKAIGVGKPLTKRFWDKKINEGRECFGMHVVNTCNYKEIITENPDKLNTVLVLNDQSPGKNENCYWTKFLNQDTAFYFGAEVMANKFNYAVVHAIIRRKQKAYYEIELKLLTDTPREEEYGFITRTYIEQLEECIIADPQYWVWSHRRWKKDLPDNLEELKQQHQERFIQKFRTKSQ